MLPLKPELEPASPPYLVFAYFWFFKEFKEFDLYRYNNKIFIDLSQLFINVIVADLFL